MRKEYTLENVLKQKIRESQIIYLLGAGASFCAGLPGIFRLTDLVRSRLCNISRRTFDEIIQFLTDNRIENPNIEEVLSELCYRLSAVGSAYRDKERHKAIFEEICRCIQNILKVDSSTEYHKEFVRRIVSRREAEPAKKVPPVQIFTTNYDLLIELACEESHIVIINGFEGIFHRRWNPCCFDYDIGKATTHTQNPRFEPSARHIRLYKLHGSLSWFGDSSQFYEEKPISESNRTPLIIYPSRLKYAQSIRPPFDWLFRRFSSAVSKAKLLICIGYRFADKHLNQYIDIGLNNGLSLLVFSTYSQVSMLNEETTIINGINQNEVNDFWDFKKFAKWIPALKEK